jgi:hypothetical protein
MPTLAELGEAFPVIISLIIIEGLLSVDNALAIDLDGTAQTRFHLFQDQDLELETNQTDLCVCQMQRMTHHLEEMLLNSLLFLYQYQH